MTSNFFSPLSFVAVFGSGIRYPGSEIRDPGSGMGKKSGSGIRHTDSEDAKVTRDIDIRRGLLSFLGTNPADPKLMYTDPYP